MNFGKYMLAAAALAMAPVTLHAQDAVELSVGATVMGNDGNPVGTITSNDGTNVTVDTGSYQVPLGAASFGAEADGTPLLNLTQGQLNDMMAQQQADAAAALDAAIAVGTPVITADAQALGAIEELIDDNVVVADGDTRVTLPRSYFALGASGELTALANMADIQAALAAAAAGG